MRSCLVLPIALVAIIAVVTPPLRVQDARSVQLYAGAGLELVSTRDGSRFTPGPTLQFGLVRQVAGSRFAARVDATYFQRDYTYTGNGYATALGASVGMMYDLGRSAWRPYVTSSLGMYVLSGAGERHRSGALIGGLGLRGAIGKVPVFGELRYHYFTNGQGFGPHKLFLTFGIRF